LDVTYKLGNLGNIPATNGLIKGCGTLKHMILKKEKKVWMRALVPSNATQHKCSIDSASKLETKPNECTFESYALVVTYKVSSTRDDPVTNGLIKG
jgi:hypothetical protein